ncbi:hypothetical protein [Micromonospora sp. CB01531]|uniref:hypothetical protein n=1 Tax=Micromonospora sp. CB01531 TaxID=1718947 RepID=UPI00093FB28D|nr:hypothetical protein [Micromonospora sp. CB01531]OKI87234.1 hypothetical protein A6A27_39795 [Micromonospora sp. CB01531]
MPEKHAPTRRGISLTGPLNFDAPADYDEFDAELRTHGKSDLPLSQLIRVARSCKVGVPSGWLDGSDNLQPMPPGLALFHLRADATTADTRDRVWRHIISHARQDTDDRPDWNLYALGVAHLGLLKRAHRLAPPGTTESRVVKLQCNLMYVFLTRMHVTITQATGHVTWRLDINRPNVFSRLLGGAYDEASGRTLRRITQRSRRHDETAAEHQQRLVRLRQEGEALHEPERPTDNEAELSHAAQENQGEPNHEPRDAEAVSAALDRLVNESTQLAPGDRIDPAHAELIRRTYLNGERLTVVAAELGMSISAASKHRSKAVDQLTRLIAGTAGIPRPRGGQ